MKTIETTGTMTSEDFERWLNLQAFLGFTVKNPESIEKIRAEFKRGATCTPFRQVDHVKEAA